MSNNKRGIQINEPETIDNIVVGNFATQNLEGNYFIQAAGNLVGPILTDPTATTNPWANFE